MSTPMKIMVLAVSVALTGAQAADVGALRCEGRSEPLGIDVAKPRLSWQLPDGRQTAYQVSVEGAWDSGRVVSEQSVGVEYGGSPLQSGRRYAWKVRTWDGESRSSAWSVTASFLTGKFRPEDWRGKWIGADAAREPAPDGVLGFAVEARAADEAQWVQVDLGQPRPIERVVLHPMHHDDPAAGGWIKGYGFPPRFRLQISDGSDFHEAATLADLTQADFPNPGWAAVAFEAGGKTGRYVRLTATKLWRRGPNLPFVCTLGELQVFVGGRNVALEKAVTASASVEGYG